MFICALLFASFDKEIVKIATKNAVDYKIQISRKFTAKDVRLRIFQVWRILLIF